MKIKPEKVSLYAEFFRKNRDVLGNVPLTKDVEQVVFRLYINIYNRIFYEN